MRGRRVEFFAEKQDLKQLITAFEANVRCQYYEAGSFESNIIPTYKSLLEIPQLGTVAHGDRNHATRLLILPVDAPLVVRSVAQRAGGMRCFVDQLANPYGFLLTLGGVFQPGILVASEVSTLATDLVSLALFNSLAKLIKKQKRIGVSYVCNYADAYLKEGWRLVADAKSPTEYDLARE